MKLSIVATCLFLFLAPAAFAQSKKSDKPDPHVEAAKRALAILEQASWKSLFNGEDLDGWEGDTEGYSAQDGVLICQKGGKVLSTKERFTDFAFSFEFKLQESGNNGIGIRGQEIQVLDHNGSKYHGEAEIEGKKRKMSWLKPWQYHGSIYGIYPARTGYLKKPGEWNQQTIVAIDDHIMVILNGAVILDVFLEEVTPVGGRKIPGGRAEPAPIQFLGHSDRVEFRHLKVVDYSPSPTRPQSSGENAPPAGFVSLFNGENLSGWKGLAHKNANERRALEGAALQEAQAVADEVMQEHWSVVEGILTYDGKGQSLCTAKDYGDFELYLDYKIPPGADSGIYLRGTPQVQIWDPWDPRTKDKPQPESPEDWVAAYRNGRNLGSGGLWNNKRSRNAPLTLADNKPGEWNTFFIRMVGDRVSIWLNDQLIVDRTELENYWDKTGQQPLPRADQIELQHHGSELFFKNLYIRELPY